MLMRDLLDGQSADLLGELTLVVVPLFNPDGNDAVDPANRRLDLPKLHGQIGPDKVGTRVTASGINLNRDYLRQAAAGDADAAVTGLSGLAGRSDDRLPRDQRLGPTATR